MSVLNILGVGSDFLVERHCEGDEFWMPRHPNDPVRAPLVVRFGQPFEDLFDSDNDSVILRANYEGEVELVFIHEGRVSDFMCVTAEEVPGVVDAVKSTWSQQMINHGTAIFKDEEHFKQFCAKDHEGIITAYLPEMQRFCVFFGEGQLCTFQWTEEKFLKHFDVELSESE